MKNSDKHIPILLKATLFFLLLFYFNFTALGQYIPNTTVDENNGILPNLSLREAVITANTDGILPRLFTFKVVKLIF